MTNNDAPDQTTNLGATEDQLVRLDGGNEHYERGRVAALDGAPWPTHPGYHTPWSEWQFWRGYRSVEEKNNATSGLAPTRDNHTYQA